VGRTSDKYTPPCGVPTAPSVITNPSCPRCGSASGATPPAMPVGDCAKTGKASTPANAAAATAALTRIAGLSNCLVLCMASSRCLMSSFLSIFEDDGTKRKCHFRSSYAPGRRSERGRHRCGVEMQALAFSREASIEENRGRPRSLDVGHDEREERLCGASCI